MSLINEYFEGSLSVAEAMKKVMNVYLCIGFHQEVL